MERIWKKYNVETINYYRSADIPRGRYLNGFTVTNIGDTPFYMMGKRFFPSTTPLTSQGDSMSFGGNEDELFTGKINLIFDTAPMLTPNAEFVFKYYVPDEE